MATVGKLDRKRAEREIGRGFLELLVIAALSLAAIAVPVALFVLLGPFGPLVALTVVALGSWWFAAVAGFGPAALAFGVGGGAVLLLARVGLFFMRTSPFYWLGREAMALAAIYLVLHA